MGRVVVVENLTLDGVMQAPGRADEDTRHGFAHGGWATPYGDEVLGRAMGERMGGPGALLLGRRTYEDFASYWPHQTDNPYTEVLDRTTKYVASRTLAEPLGWQGSVLLSGDAVEAARTLRREVDGTITVLGSGELVRSLLPHGVIDEYLLVTFPLVLGSGQRLFPGDGTVAPLELLDSRTTTTGVVIATYRRPP